MDPELSLMETEVKELCQKIADKILKCPDEGIREQLRTIVVQNVLSVCGGDYVKTPDLDPLTSKMAKMSVNWSPGSNQTSKSLSNVLGDQEKSTLFSPGSSDDTESTTPPSYPGHKRKREYTAENLLKAVEAVQNGSMTALNSARVYGIPSRVLYDKIKYLAYKRRIEKGLAQSKNMKDKETNTDGVDDAHEDQKEGETKMTEQNPEGKETNVQEDKSKVEQ